MMVKVWSFNDGFWFAAETIEEAMAAAHADGYDVDDPPMQESASRMETLTYYDNIYNVEESDKRTFAEQLANLVAEGIEFPCFFATSEF